MQVQAGSFLHFGKILPLQLYKACYSNRSCSVTLENHGREVNSRVWQVALWKCYALFEMKGGGGDFVSDVWISR